MPTSWEWLTTIAPCVQILVHHLASEINYALRSQQGSKDGSPDLTEDVEELMGSLSQNGIHVLHAGRRLDDELKTMQVSQTML